MNDLLGDGGEFRLWSGIAVPQNLARDELDVHTAASADETTFLFGEVAVHIAGLETVKLSTENQTSSAGVGSVNCVPGL